MQIRFKFENVGLVGGKKEIGEPTTNLIHYAKFAIWNRDILEFSQEQ